MKFGIIDGMVKEPTGGAHTDYEETANNLKATILEALSELDGMSGDDLRNQRYDKYRAMGAFLE